MANYTGTNVAGTSGAVVTARTGTASADTVPAGSLVVWRNTGAGSHTVTLTNNQTVEGLAVSNRVITLAAGEVWAGRVSPSWGDSNGNVGVAINGTASEVVYYILGGV
jgi:hypothetical protein